jgi:hypothetical protein
MSVRVTFTSEQLATPGAADIGEALETNHIAYFPESPIRLPDAATLDWLRRDLPSRMKLKNISYHPEAGRIAGLAADPATGERLTAILKDHLGQVSAFLRARMPHLTEDWTVGTCSFRPIQEKGRNLKPHASNELIHFDAGAYGATDGDRILRFFVNFSDHEDRVWATRGPIESLVRRYGRQAGLLDADGRLAVRLEKSVSDRALSGIVRGLTHLNPLARVLDSTPYDRAMRRLHNFMKDDADFRADRRDYEELRFPPGAAWMVFTDSVSHASVSGQYAFITTFIVRRRNMKHPQYAPFNVLAALQEPARAA